MTLNPVTFDVPGRRSSRGSLLLCPRTGETFRAVEIRRSLLWDNDAAKFRNGLQVVRDARRERYALMLIDYYFLCPCTASVYKASNLVLEHVLDNRCLEGLSVISIQLSNSVKLILRVR